MRVSTAGSAIAGLAVTAAVACVDFNLDERRFRCDGNPDVCGAGWQCGSDGFCERSSDGGGDPAVDAASTTSDAGGAICSDAGSCNDDNPCTTDPCTSSDTCEHTPVTDGTGCGVGCTCSADGQPEEVACGDGGDNDGDGDPDCNDADCPSCQGGLMCCASGACRTQC